MSALREERKVLTVHHCLMKQLLLLANVKTNRKILRLGFVPICNTVNLLQPQRVKKESTAHCF